MGVDDLPVVFAATSVDVDLVDAHPTLALPEITTSPKEQNNWECEVSLEEVLGGSGAARSGWCNSDKELSGKWDKDEEKSEVWAVNTTDSLKWDLIKGVALESPGFTEPNVCLCKWSAFVVLCQILFTYQADWPPSEECCEAGERKKPVEDNGAGRCENDVSEGSKKQVERHSWKRTSRSVDVGEDFRSVPLLR